MFDGDMCPFCLKGEMVRKDGGGLRCNKCGYIYYDRVEVTRGRRSEKTRKAS